MSSTILPSLEESLRLAAEREERRARRKPRRFAALVLAATLAISGGAAAITGLLPLGDQAPNRVPLGTTPWGTPLPHGDGLLPVRAADPDGGPEWGLREIRTSGGSTCLQLGRVQGTMLGVVGADGRFHPLAPTLRTCHGESTASGLQERVVMLASGAVTFGVCTPDPSEGHTNLPPCDPNDLRTIDFGVRPATDGGSPTPYITVQRGLPPQRSDQSEAP